MTSYETLRRKIGKIIGSAIPVGGYSEKITKLDLEGRITPRETKNILVAILEWIDQEEENGHPRSDGDSQTI